MKSKVNAYLISGIFLTYFGLKDDNFVIWYNGVALILGITALVFAYIEYRKIIPICVCNVAKINWIIFCLIEAKNYLHSLSYGNNFNRKVREKETIY